MKKTVIRSFFCSADRVSSAATSSCRHKRNSSIFLSFDKGENGVKVFAPRLRTEMGRFHQLKLMYTSLPSAESEDSQLYSNMSPFRTMERRFKRIYLGDGLDNKALLLKHPILKSFIEPSLAPICLTAENKEDNKEEVDDEGCQTDGGGGVKIVQVKGSLEHLCRDFGDKCRQETSEWWCRQCNHETAQIEEGEEEESSLTTDVITFDGHPGLIVIRNAFSPKAQRNVIRACLREYTRSPNYTSLSKWYSTPSNPWDLYEEWRKEAELFENDNTNVPQRNSKKFERPSFHSDCTVKLRDSKFMLQLSNLTVKLQQNQTVSSPTSSSSSNFATTAPPALSPISASTCNLEQGCSTTTARACTLAIPKSPYDSPSIPFSTPPQLKPIPISTAIRKCRWTNLGLLYDWTHKMYTPTPTNEPLLHPHHPLQVPPMVNPPVPPLISRLVKAVIKLTSCLTGYDADRFECEGGIVNFYGIKDTLMAHQDRSEPNKTAPLVSFR